MKRHVIRTRSSLGARLLGALCGFFLHPVTMSLLAAVEAVAIAMLLRSLP